MSALASLPVKLLPAAVLLEEDPPRSELLVEEIAVLPDTSLARELVAEELAVDPEEVEVVAWGFVCAAEPVVELAVALVEVPEALSVPVALVFVAVLEVSEAGADVEDPNPAEPIPVVVVAAAAAAVVSRAAPFVGDGEGGFEVTPLVVSDTTTAALDGAFVATGEADSVAPETVVVDVCGFVVVAAAVLVEGVAELPDSEVVAVAIEVSDVDDPEFVAELVEVPVVVLVPVAIGVDGAVATAAVGVLDVDGVDLPVVEPKDVPAITVEPLVTAPLQLSRTMTVLP